MIFSRAWAMPNADTFSIKPIGEFVQRYLTKSTSFGWNSAGMGISRGFDLIELLTVCHGAAHNDTICVAERRTTFDCV